MTDRYPLPEWPGYTVSADGVVFNKRGTALTHDSQGRVALRNGNRMHRVHVGLCLQMAGLIHARRAGENYGAILARCKELEEELSETQRRLTSQKGLMQDIRELETERDMLAADLNKARAALCSAKAAVAPAKKRAAEKPVSSSSVEELEKRLRLARKANGHLIALLHQRGGIAPTTCFLEQI